MNLIELENLVKGVPDEYLTKEVQAPTGQIPPFLALSEIQRRKDMRQRYEAQQGAVDKPTIAAQLTGGIGAMQPQGAPAPAAPGGMGAPPVAAGAAPMPTPPGQPQGFAAGGQVGYAFGGPVATDTASAGMNWMNYLDDEELNRQLAMAGTPEMDAAIRAQMGDQAPPVAAPAALRPASEALGVQPGGLGDIPTTGITPTPATPAPAAPAPKPALPGIPASRGGKSLLTEGQLAALNYMENFQLPEALKYDEFIAAANKEESDIRAAAKQEALGAALVQLGAGLAAGNMAAGFAEAGQQAQQAIKEGRRDAAAQKALAQQFKLRGMEGERALALEQARMRGEAMGQRATWETDAVRRKEDQDLQMAQWERQAKQENARIQIARDQLGISRESADNDRIQTAFTLIGNSTASLTGKPPTENEMEEHQKKEKRWVSQYNMILQADGKKAAEAYAKSNPRPVNPQQQYINSYNTNFDLVAKRIAPQFKLDPDMFLNNPAAAAPSPAPARPGKPTTKWDPKQRKLVPIT